MSGSQHSFLLLQVPDHFTTIDPNLGVVDMGDQSFVMADIAGIIEGAHQGLGLGFKFLKHIERTKVLVHVVDVSGLEGRDPVEDYIKINNELREYDPSLLDKPQIVAANKVDLVTDRTKVDELKNYVKAEGKSFFEISAATRSGIDSLLKEVLYRINTYVPSEKPEMEMFDFSADENRGAEYREIRGYKDKDGVYVLEGKQLTKIFNSTNFNDMGSMRYLYRYISDRGGIKQLIKLGLKEGDTVRIENYEFEYTEE